MPERAGSAEAAPSDEALRQVALSRAEYGLATELLGRAPNDLELGIIGAMWSEHCGYKNSAPLLRTFPTEGPDVVQGPGENAGAVRIGGGLAAVFKVESHNHPSAIEPYQGAATGVGGIVRDIFTMGARPVALLNSLRFGPADEPETRRLSGGVVRGIGDYGNSLGIPTIGGEIGYAAAYRGNPLVNALCVGLAPADGLVRAVAGEPGNVLLLVGADTGRDGIHGATFASVDDPQASHRGVVQVGNPFLEKLLMEACLEIAARFTERQPVAERSGWHGDPGGGVVGAHLRVRPGAGEHGDLEGGDGDLPLRERGAASPVRGGEGHATDRAYVVGMQDLGAAGLTSSAVECAGRAGSGIELDVACVPRRETGMTPYEVMLSESQERMLLAVRPDGVDAVRAVFERWNLHSDVIGAVTGDGLLRVRAGAETVAELPIGLMTEDVPRYTREGRPTPELVARRERDIGPLVAGVGRSAEHPDGLGDQLLRLLGSPNLRSKRWAWEQYDHTIGSSTVLGPGQADAAVLRVRPPSELVAPPVRGAASEAVDDPALPNVGGRPTGLPPPPPAVDGRASGDGAPGDSPGTEGASRRERTSTAGAAPTPGLAITMDCNSLHCYLDPYAGGMGAVVEAARNLAAVGARPLGMTNCLNFGNPERPEGYWHLAECVRGMADACRALGVPVVSGNVSLYNESGGEAVHPTPTVGMVGVVPDVTRAVGIGFREGDAVCLVTTGQAPTLGASAWLRTLAGEECGQPPVPSPLRERALHDLLRAGIGEGWIRSAHDLSEGGLAVGLAECAVAGNVGLDATASDAADPLALFGERHGAAVIGVQPEDAQRVAEAATAAGLECVRLGNAGGEIVALGPAVRLPISALAAASSG